MAAILNVCPRFKSEPGTHIIVRINRARPQGLLGIFQNGGSLHNLKNTQKALGTKKNKLCCARRQLGEGVGVGLGEDNDAPAQTKMNSSS